MRINVKIVSLLMSPLLWLISTSANAEWTFFNANFRNDLYYVDYDTLKKTKKPRIWTLTKYGMTTELGFKSEKILWEADCAENRLRELSVRYYSESSENSIASLMRDKAGEWIYADPKSVAESLLVILCGKK
jgi:hypothetical protein